MPASVPGLAADVESLMGNLGRIKSCKLARGAAPSKAERFAWRHRALRLQLREPAG